ncbi:VOC family protein [Acerihabitans sp. TG2]|uniref:VOC family protein n=1 Tax=Acerihabitans sp. TG2 TaxID=3096008 RepID=UPI002B236FBD|nr:VOC family protein [Acerihabitans sp. TG2]MEA9392959.1 VOC family protein [Acerihabitans sp. TG2]
MNWIDVPPLADLVEDLARFEQQVLSLAERLGLRLDDNAIDHISLRCHQESTAQRWFTGWQRCGVCLKHQVFNGRPIALFALEHPLILAKQSIACVELPWPGLRRYPYEGWEHIEIVLVGPSHTLVPRALTLLDDDALAAPGISIKHSTPYDPAERLPNPTLAISDGQVTIKFHPHSLRSIVAAEEN